MLELFLASRFAADYFWDHKALSVLHTVVAGVVLLLIIVARRGYLPRPSPSDWWVLAMVLIVLQSLLRTISLDELIEAAKFFSYALFFCLGRLIPTAPDPRLLSRVSMVALLAMAMSAALGQGYAIWGEAETFVAGYYYKTDAALSCLIFTAIIMARSPRLASATLAIACAVYVVYKTNARIALPLVLAVPILCRVTKRYGELRSRELALQAITLLGISVLSGIGLAVLIGELRPDLLAFSVRDPFSDENTQGRNFIWAALISSFEHSSTTDQFLGQGLYADINATLSYSISSELAGARAHNSLLYLLLALGIFGAVIFVGIFVSSRRTILHALRSERHDERVWAIILVALLVIFVGMSFTTEVVVRPQLMIPIFMILGFVVSAGRRVEIDAYIAGKYEDLFFRGARLGG